MNIQSDIHFTAVTNHQREALRRAELERRLRRQLAASPTPVRSFLGRVLGKEWGATRQHPSPRPV